MIQQSEKFNWKRIQENNYINWINEKIEPLIKEFWWFSFNKWVFRVHTYESCNKWGKIIDEYFPNRIWKFQVFWFDRMWRQFAINLENDNEILMFDITVRKSYIADETFNSFISIISNNPDEYIINDDFKEFNIELKFNQSISHKIPLVLWWKDDVSNMEVCDMEVDWWIVGQLHAQI